MDALAGGKTANLIYAGLEPGTVGIYRVRLQLNPDLPTDPLTQVTIAQYVYVSNIVTVPDQRPGGRLEPWLAARRPHFERHIDLYMTINAAAPQGRIERERDLFRRQRHRTGECPGAARIHQRELYRHRGCRHIGNQRDSDRYLELRHRHRDANGQSVAYLNQRAACGLKPFAAIAVRVSSRTAGRT